MSVIAAIDCGTNSIRLLIAERADGGSREMVREMRVVRLGEGVDVTGRLSEAALERTFAACREYAQLCREHEVASVRFVATSASRDAANGADFVAGVQAIFTEAGYPQVVPEVVSGSSEAGLSFNGATASCRASGLAAPFMVVDLGGGSTELARGDAGPEQVYSMDIGCVRMTERFLASDPPTEAEIAALSEQVNSIIDQAAGRVDLAGVRTLVGVAGSITTITAHALGLASYQRDQVHLAQVSPEQMLASCDALVHATRAQRAAMPFMHPGRVDVIGAGAVIWAQVIRRVLAASPEAILVTSEHDILDGIAASIP